MSKAAQQDHYSMKPTFRVFTCVLSVTISGMVSDSLGAGLEDIVVQAAPDCDTTSTITCESGMFQFILLAGTYDLSAKGFELEADTRFAGVGLSPGDRLTDYHFILQ